MFQQISQQVLEQRIAMRTQGSLLNLPAKNVLVEVATDRGLEEEKSVGTKNSIITRMTRMY